MTTQRPGLVTWTSDLSLASAACSGMLPSILLASAAQARSSQVRTCCRADLSTCGSLPREHVALLVDVHLRMREADKSGESAHRSGSQPNCVVGVFPGPKLMPMVLFIRWKDANLLAAMRHGSVDG